MWEIISFDVKIKLSNAWTKISEIIVYYLLKEQNFIKRQKIMSGLIWSISHLRN